MNQPHVPDQETRNRLLKNLRSEFLDRSAQRVKCEHAYAGIKRYNAVASIYGIM